MNRTAVTILRIGLLMTLVGGWGDDETEKITDPVDDPTVSRSLQELRQNFQPACSEMDSTGYAAVQADDFVFEFPATDLEEIILPDGDREDRAAELASAGKMFSGSPGWDGVKSMYQEDCRVRRPAPITNRIETEEPPS